MSPTDLHAALDALADDLTGALEPTAAPRPEVADVAWRGGARRRTRSRLAGGAALALALAVIALLIAPLGVLRTDAPNLPAGESRQVEGWPTRVIRPLFPEDALTAHRPMALALADSSTGDTWVVSATGEVWRLENRESVFGIGPSLSPDGRWIVSGLSLTDLVQGRGVTLSEPNLSSRSMPPNRTALWSPDSRQALIPSSNQGQARTFGLVVTTAGVVTELPGLPTVPEASADPRYAGWLDSSTILAYAVSGADRQATLTPFTWTVGESSWRPFSGTITVQGTGAPAGAAYTAQLDLSPAGDVILARLPLAEASGQLTGQLVTAYDRKSGRPVRVPGWDPKDGAAGRASNRIQWSYSECPVLWRAGVPMRPTTDPSGAQLQGGTGVEISNRFATACLAAAGNELRGAAHVDPLVGAKDVALRVLTSGLFWLVLVALLVVLALRGRRAPAPGSSRWVRLLSGLWVFVVLLVAFQVLGLGANVLSGGWADSVRGYVSRPSGTPASSISTPRVMAVEDSRGVWLFASESPPSPPPELWRPDAGFGEGVTAPALSPDGTWLARGSHLVKLGDHLVDHPLWQGPESYPVRAVWAPDSARLLLAPQEAGPAAYVAEPGTSVRSPVPPVPVPDAVRYAGWLDERTVLAYAVGAEGSTGYSWRLGETTWKRFGPSGISFEGGGPDEVSLSPGAEFVMFSSGHGSGNGVTAATFLVQDGTAQMSGWSGFAAVSGCPATWAGQDFARTLQDGRLNSPMNGYPLVRLWPGAEGSCVTFAGTQYSTVTTGGHVDLVRDWTRAHPWWTLIGVAALGTLVVWLRRGLPRLSRRARRVEVSQ